MKKWELARYLIDAKKSIDTIMYIAENLNQFKHIPVREIISSCRQTFYINCGVILDEFCDGKKKDLCGKDKVAKQIYYERDKNYAHKDYNYEPPKYSDLEEMISNLKQQISHVRSLCYTYLPKEITLNFVPHNPVLFRLINGITLDVEEEINKAKHPNYNGNKIDTYDGHPIFEDTEDLRSIREDDRKNFAIIFKAGLNIYEDLQNRQDSCILANALHNLNIWCVLNTNILNELEAIIELDCKERLEIK